MIDHLKLRYYGWRYAWLWDCFDSIDKYYDHTSPKEAAKHITKWARFRKQDAIDAEKYRKEVSSLKIMLVMSGIDIKAIEVSDWADRCLNINCLSAVVKDDLGYRIIDYICKAGLVQSDEDGVFIWSANAPSQLKHFVFDSIFNIKAERNYGK